MKNCYEHLSVLFYFYQTLIPIQGYHVAQIPSLHFLLTSLSDFLKTHRCLLTCSSSMKQYHGIVFLWAKQIWHLRSKRKQMGVGCNGWRKQIICKNLGTWKHLKLLTWFISQHCKITHSLWISCVSFSRDVRVPARKPHRIKDWATRARVKTLLPSWSFWHVWQPCHKPGYIRHEWENGSTLVVGSVTDLWASLSRHMQH